MERVETKAWLNDMLALRNGRYLVSFMCERIPPNFPDVVKEICLRLTVKEWKDKRSNQANAYMWALFDKMAKKLNAMHKYEITAGDLKPFTANSVHDMSVIDYGYPELDDNENPIVILVNQTVDVSILNDYWRNCGRDGDGIWYMLIRGTRDLKTDEFSHFLDCVIGDAKALGIETDPPDEIERIKALWQRD